MPADRVNARSRSLLYTADLRHAVHTIMVLVRRRDGTDALKVGVEAAFGDIVAWLMWLPTMGFFHRFHTFRHDAPSWILMFQKVIN